jgi:hypothetical protein
MDKPKNLKIITRPKLNTATIIEEARNEKNQISILSPVTKKVLKVKVTDKQASDIAKKQSNAINLEAQKHLTSLVVEDTT